MTQEAFADKRLLGALDYIDERFIAEVTEDYESFEVPGVYKPNKRAHRRAYRQFAAMAACLILLTSAFPVVGKFLAGKGVNLGGWGGNAGAGTSELEMPTTPESEIIDSPYERAIDAYPSDMSIDEIYEDIIKGGWVVLDSDYCKGFLYGNELWTAFIDKVNMKQPAAVLVADMARWAELSHKITGCHYTKERIPTLFLMEITFDGELFGYKRMDCFKDEITDSGEYRYLITDICECTAENTIGMISGYRETICLTNDISWTYDSFSKQAFTDEGRTSEFFINPCQIIAIYFPIYETKAGYGNPVCRSLGFSELIVD